VIAAFLIVIGTITAASGPTGSGAVTFAGNCIRAGVVLGALWFALPQIQSMLARLPGWLMSWFVGKGKGRGDSATDSSPAVRQRRPRRRSNS